jgi:hypothetical protein
VAKAAKKRAPIGEKDDLTPEEQSKLEHVLRQFDRAEKLHKLLRPRWNLFYGLYRNYRKLGNDLKAASPRDRDTVVQEFVRVFGAELFIPYAFSTVETVVPRVLSNDPRMLVLANKPEGEAAVEPVRARFERDQSAINYELKLQDVCRSGLMYGLGWQKTYWEEKYRKGRKFEPRLLGMGEKIVDDRKLVYEGPQIEAPDIFDMFWDPAAKDIETCGFVIHRTWRTTEYVADRVKAGAWLPLDLDAVSKMQTEQGRGDMWAERMQAAGLANGNMGSSDLHEVLEYHDRERVYTVLDRCILVQDGANPHHHGDLPFQIYRPTRVPSEFCGVGEIEPIAHLQFELNTMRSQRRDAATLALNRGYFYQKGSIQKRDMVMGPGAMVPTTMDPRESIWPMPIQDIPASSVSEEEALKGDIVLTSGISETVAGTSSPSASTTATQVQLVQNAAGERIRLKAKNLVKETVTPATAQWRELYIQKLPAKAQKMRVPDTSTPSGYSFIEISRKDFQNVDVVPEAGSTAPENEAEKKANAMQFTQALAPFMEELKTDKVLEYVLAQYGVRSPESWLKTEKELEEEAKKQGPPPGPPMEGAPMAGPPMEEPPPNEPMPAAPMEEPSLIETIGQGLVERGMQPDQVEMLLEQVTGQVGPEDPGAFVAAVGEALVTAGMDAGEATALLQEITQPGPGV